MIRIAVLVSLVVSGFLAAAEGKKDSLKKADSKPLELPAQPPEVKSPDSSFDVKFESTCKTSGGSTIKQGDKGYEACVANPVR